MKFVLELADLEGTNMQRRIDDIRAMGSKATDTYKLKAHSKQKKFNTRRHMYNDV